MHARPTPPADDASPGSKPWKESLGSGLLLIIFATAWLWGASREFRPPPEEPKSAEAELQELQEVVEFHRESSELSTERSRITDAIGRRIKELEATPVVGDDHAARHDELRRLRETLWAEMEKTAQLQTARWAERAERKRLADAPRQAQVARAAEQWRRARPVFLALGLFLMAWAGGLVWKAHRLHSEQVLAERAAGDPQWNQRLVIYLVQLAVCIGLILFGLSASAPRAGVEDTREELLFLGLFGLATSTVFLFFGSIDWSTWNAIKDRMKSLKSPPEDQRPPDASADG